MVWFTLSRAREFVVFNAAPFRIAAGLFFGLDPATHWNGRGGAAGTSNCACKEQKEQQAQRPGAPSFLYFFHILPQPWGVR